jgi:hypothetical protein
MARVTIAEANQVKSYGICYDLLKAGYVLASVSGIRFNDQRPDELDSVGILRNLPRKYIFGWIPLPQKREWIGSIYFSEKGRGANNTNWVIEVFGRDNLPIFREIADALLEKFHVDIHVRLEHTDALAEQYPDWDDCG